MQMVHRDAGEKRGQSTLVSVACVRAAQVVEERELAPRRASATTAVGAAARGLVPANAWLERFQVCRGHPTVMATLELKRDLLILIQPGQAGTLDSSDVYEHILGAVFRLNEPEAFAGVEELYGASNHGFSQSGVAAPEIGQAASNFRSEKTNESARNGQAGLAETNSTASVWAQSDG